jgi:hypothetical protein
MLEKSAGFYSMLFFAINHYLYAKQNNIDFTIVSHEWLYKYKDGWSDYFKNIDVHTFNTDSHITLRHHQPIGSFTITEYKNIIPDVYKYNSVTEKYIYDTKKRIGLLDKKYDSLFIRRGDKLASESPYIPTEKYIEILLQKNMDCKTIFLQTDDYNSYIDLQNYIQKHNLNIEIITICHENTKGGMIIYNMNKEGIDWALKNNVDNKEYISTVIKDLQESVAMDCLDNQQMYNHTIELLAGIEIVLKSQNCVCDYSSNVARFIKLAHENMSSVFNVLSPDSEIDMTRTTCPAFELL